MFLKILIANRGEIARRIIRTCKRMGVGTVSVYSEADFRSLYVQEADEAAFIGPPSARDSYLDMHKIISAALRHGCQAVHPGYGFLSENAGFARMVADAGLVFIGPPVSAIATLGDKPASKALAVKTGVPVTPGYYGDLTNLKTVAAVAAELEYPVLLKPAAGGGGRGMRIVASEEELPAALAACREETRKGFADDRIFMERYVTRPRHIEVQIIADQFGAAIHLGERECSIQRRYQKVIEETPSTAVDASLREEMGRVAVALAQAAGYTNAGTVEFILDSDKNFYFLEMNTRLQVEHPITELVTSLDLVELQLRIAAGEPLPVTQEDVVISGWAIEARVCAEDPQKNFFPTTGMITRYAMPRGERIRVDSGIDAGSVVTIHYDSLLAKVAAWGATRQEAAARLVKALNGYHIEGVTTNVDFCNAIVNHPAFLTGDLSTSFIDEHFIDGESGAPSPTKSLHFMVIAASLVFHNRRKLVRDSLRLMSPMVGGTHGADRSTDYVVKAGNEHFNMRLAAGPVTRVWHIEVNGTAYEVVSPEFEFYRRRMKLRIDGASYMFRLKYEGSHLRAAFCGITRTFEVYTPQEWALHGYMLRDVREVVEDVLKCPMPGLVTEILVETGVYVRRGQELLRMESMKMESAVAAPRDGLVENILVRPGQAVETDDVLMKFAV